MVSLVERESRSLATKAALKDAARQIFYKDSDEDSDSSGSDDCDPRWYAQHADHAVSRLENSDWHVREAALRNLRKMVPAALARKAGAMVARLEYCEWNVRYKALVMLRKLEPAALAQHAGAVVARLEDSSWEVRH